MVAAVLGQPVVDPSPLDAANSVSLEARMTRSSGLVPRHHDGNAADANSVFLWRGGIAATPLGAPGDGDIELTPVQQSQV